MDLNFRRDEGAEFLERRRKNFAIDLANIFSFYNQDASIKK